LELLIFKYQQQNISVSITLISAVTALEVTFADRTTLLLIWHMKTMQQLPRETPDFITPTLWPANRPDLNPVDYHIWGKLQEPVYCSWIDDV